MDNKEGRDREICVRETMDHIREVQSLMSRVASDVINRGGMHDASKLAEPEFSMFATVNGKLREMTYGSNDYRATLREIKPAIDHHYHHVGNRHHPEHFRYGVNDMTLVDLVEMLCDWIAATKRHDNGDIMHSIKVNTERFGLSEQLVKILRNTVEYLSQ